MELEGCAIKGNSGAGIEILPECNATLQKCDLAGNDIGAIIKGSNPTLTECRLHDNRHNGILVLEKGQGTVENCEVFGNGKAGIEIKQGSNPLIRECRIHDGKANGIYIGDSGRGTIENCDLSGNILANIEIKQGGDPTLYGCQIHDGRSCGILVGEGGKGKVEDCDIYGNAGAGIEIEAGGDPIVWLCQIHDGKQFGVLIRDGEPRKIRDCEIYGNAEQILKEKEEQKLQGIPQEKITPKNLETIADESSSKIMNAEEYLSIIKPRLQKENFDIIKPNSIYFDLIASGKKQFELIKVLGSGQIYHLFAFSSFATLDIKSYKIFSDNAVEYCLKWRKENINWMERQFVTLVYPVALVQNLNNETAQAIKNENVTRRKFSIIDVFPIAFDLQNKQLYFSDKQSHIFWKELKKNAEEILSL